MYGSALGDPLAVVHMMAWINRQLVTWLLIPARIRKLRSDVDYVISRAARREAADAARRARGRLNSLEGEYNTITSKLRIQEQLAGPLVVIAVIGGFTVAAVVAGMAAVFRKLDVEEQIIEGLKSGTLSQEELNALERRRAQEDNDSSPLGDIASTVKTVAVVGLLVAAMPLLRRMVGRGRR